MKPNPKMKIKKQPTPPRKDLSIDELRAIVARTAAGALSTEDHAKLVAVIDTLAFLTLELEAKGASIGRLRRLLFGASTEKTSRVVGETSGPADGDQADAAPGSTEPDPAAAAPAEERTQQKRKGHGRNGADTYTGATRIRVPYPGLEHAQACPCCQSGKVYPQSEPAVLVRVRGMAPLNASVYELDRLRCNLCGEVFTAPAPDGVGDQKYDETAAAMVALLKYGCGLPFHRIERLEQSLGLPLPAATQWEIVSRAEALLAPAYAELIRQAAQGEVVHNDDTTMKILDLPQPAPSPSGSGKGSKERTGVFTTGIVSTREKRSIALFFTGRKHAGENLEALLKQRAEELGPPIQMCDALACNTAGDFNTIVANCLAHGRRQFVEVAENFPDECRYVLETLSEVYLHDAIARERHLSPEERLRFHQVGSGPILERLETWLRELLDGKKVEPNSGLGQAARYMLGHWKELTLFLREPGAPLDNNLCERALKKAILHRKNALFYKTENGARVGDTFMGLIFTAELCDVNPFDYLVALQRHHQTVANDPAQWMPWNYHEALGRLTPAPAPPPTG